MCYTLILHISSIFAHYFRIVDKLMDLLQLLCAHDENRRLFAEKGMVALLDLAVKMNKKNAGICSKAAQLSTLLQ